MAMASRWSGKSSSGRNRADQIGTSENAQSVPKTSSKATCSRLRIATIRFAIARAVSMATVDTTARATTQFACQARDEFDQLGVEQRRAHLERRGHARAVDLRQHRMREIEREVLREHALEVRPRRLTVALARGAVDVVAGAEEPLEARRLERAQ